MAAPAAEAAQAVELAPEATYAIPQQPYGVPYGQVSGATVRKRLLPQ